MRPTLLSLPLALAACSTTLRPPDLGALYNTAAMASHEGRNPVIVIPGLLGSRLEQAGTGRVVWGAFGGGAADPHDADGRRLFALPMAEGVPLEDLSDDVVPVGALESLQVSLFGLPIDVRAYANILLALGVGGFRDQALGESGAIDYGSDHYTCFQFSYDWRQGVPENAARLDAFVRETAEVVRLQRARRGARPDEPVRFDLVAHSMGGLVARWWLRYGSQLPPPDGPAPVLTWAGAARVERAVLVGTPNHGSAQAFVELVEGTKLGPFLPRYPPALVGTLPAAYQLLPRSRHGAVTGPDGAAVDLFDAGLWEACGWGLLDPAQAGVLRDLLPDEPDPVVRERIARDHVEKCLRRAAAVHAALDRPAASPAGLELFLVAGDALETRRELRVASGGALAVGPGAPGDGTVTRASALADERVGGEYRPGLVSPVPWRGVTFYFEDHLGLTQSEAFLDNLLFLLLELPR